MGVALAQRCLGVEGCATFDGGRKSEVQNTHYRFEAMVETMRLVGIYWGSSEASFFFFLSEMDSSINNGGVRVGRYFFWVKPKVGQNLENKEQGMNFTRTLWWTLFRWGFMSTTLEASYRRNSWQSEVWSKYPDLSTVHLGTRANKPQVSCKDQGAHLSNVWGGGGGRTQVILTVPRVRWVCPTQTLLVR